MFLGPHHFHIRKRIHEKFEPYPHPDKWKRFIDMLIYIGGIVSPVMTLPQLFKIWVEKNIVGVSLATWVAFLVGGLFWIAYGVIHKEKPIIFIYSLGTVINALIVAGIIINQ